jgi:uncharacterized membrane protein YphA (DoxX/SURF4 family)
MNPKLNKWIYLILRIGFGVILIWASVDKILHPVDFASSVTNYRVLGDGLSRWVAVWIPYLEALTGLLLILGIWSDATVMINGILMAVFLILVIQAYIRGLDINCGCFAVKGEAPIGLLKITENVVFTCGACVLIWWRFKRLVKE